VAPDEADQAVIDARPVAFPVVADEVNMGFVAYEAPVDAVRPFVDEATFAVAARDDGRVDVNLVLADYRQGDLGACAQVALAVPVAPLAGGPAGPLYCHSAVSSRFPDEVLYWVFGVATRHADVSVGYGRGAVTFRVVDGGEPALEVVLRRPPDAGAAGPLDVVAYTCAGERPQEVACEIGVPAATIGADDIAVTVGDAPWSEAVAALGLVAPTGGLWGEGLHAVLNRPTAVPPPPPPA
jgi:hypothetical protein